MDMNPVAIFIVLNCNILIGTLEALGSKEGLLKLKKWNEEWFCNPFPKQIWPSQLLPSEADWKREKKGGAGDADPIRWHSCGTSKKQP